MEVPKVSTVQVWVLLLTAPMAGSVVAFVPRVVEGDLQTPPILQALGALSCFLSTFTSMRESPYFFLRLTLYSKNVSLFLAARLTCFFPVFVGSSRGAEQAASPTFLEMGPFELYHIWLASSFGPDLSLLCTKLVPAIVSSFRIYLKFYFLWHPQFSLSHSSW